MSQPYMALPFFIDRQEMPQIDNVPDCVQWLRQNGHPCFDMGASDPRLFRKHQRISMDAQAAARLPREAWQKPILASSDYYILDGNHRWYHALEEGMLINAWVVGMPFGEAMTLLQAYPGVRFELGRAA